MNCELENLKAWCHWKRREVDVSEDDLLFVKAIENVISQAENMEAAIKKTLKIVNAQAIWTSDSTISAGLTKQALQCLHFAIQASLDGLNQDPQPRGFDDNGNPVKEQS